jgi:hypothetical protein
MGKCFPCSVFPGSPSGKRILASSATSQRRFPRRPPGSARNVLMDSRRRRRAGIGAGRVLPFLSFSTLTGPRAGEAQARFRRG